MKIRRITDEIEKYAKPELAVENDRERIGLQVGWLDAECTGVVVCLDCTLEVLEQAVKEGCNLVVAHHPLIYHPMQKIDMEDGHARIAIFALKHGITVYSAHTNMDCCELGINRELIDLFEADFSEQSKEDACLFFARLEPITLRALTKRISEVLKDDSVKYVGNGNKIISKICICSGGGGGSQEIAVAMKGGADVYISGDFSHHDYLFALENEFAVIEYSHFASEIIVVDLFEKILSAIEGLKIVKSTEKRPFRTMEEL
ncbi:MAG: Nif3-like dinuclear metal center hexameric protein [Clostridia bacterium]|nr:Nif3-like dinuclear metal center hexameric protein [Clostridia bacterium]